MHSPKETTLVAPLLNYITDIDLELKVKLSKIKIETKEINKQLSIIHLSLINKVRLVKNLI